MKVQSFGYDTEQQACRNKNIMDANTLSHCKMDCPYHSDDKDSARLLFLHKELVHEQQLVVYGIGPVIPVMGAGPGNIVMRNVS